MDLSALNPAQRQAVTSSSQHIRVIAGAGTGKTRVLTMRLAFLVEECGVDPARICTITYTNKATNEMRQRIGRLLGPDAAGRPHISTIHSFCVTVLRQDIRYLGWPTNFTVMDQDDMRTLVRQAYKQLGYDLRTLSQTAALNYIAAKKYQRLDYDTIVAQTHGQAVARQLAEVYNFYVMRQNDMFALDFDDLIAQTHHLFTAFPEVLDRWQRRFQYYLVDEFQDIERTQYEILRLLALSGDDVMVVGDPDQTIYTFRGADINLIMRFPRDFSPCESIVLTDNYRSTPMILTAADSVIAHNFNRVAKKLTPTMADGPKLLHYTALSQEAEAAWVVQQIGQLAKGGLALHDIAILYRANYLSRPFEKELMAAHLPYVMFGGIRFFDRAEVKDMLCYLRLVASGDDLAFQRVANVPPRGLGTKTLDDLYDHARTHGLTMYQAIPSFTAAPAVHHRLLAFRDMIEAFRVAAGQLPIDRLAAAVFLDSGYRAMLEKAQDDERLANVKELIADAAAFAKSYPDSDLAAYLQQTATITAAQPAQTGEYLQMSTCHMAKGLEFDTVFLVGMSEGAFPSQPALQDGVMALEEERRLCYVAMTRARYRLCLTDSQNYSELLMKNKVTSRFIGEIDPSCIIHAGMTFKPSTLRGPDEQPATGATLSGPCPSVSTKVSHEVFGVGTVVRVTARDVEVDFGPARGIKSFRRGHPALRSLTLPKPDVGPDRS